MYLLPSVGTYSQQINWSITQLSSHLPSFASVHSFHSPLRPSASLFPWDFSGNAARDSVKPLSRPVAETMIRRDLLTQPCLPSNQGIDGTPKGSVASQRMRMPGVSALGSATFDDRHVILTKVLFPSWVTSASKKLKIAKIWKFNSKHISLPIVLHTSY